MSEHDMRRVPRIETLRVKNYRVLRDVQLDKMTPLTVLIGPNGSGKSTLFDVFAFLAECFASGLPNAWGRRGGMRELRSRGEDGPITIELKYRERAREPLITYHLAIDEHDRAPVVAEEWLEWRRGRSHGRPFRFLSYQLGEGNAIEGDMPDEEAARTDQPLTSPALLAVSALGQLQSHPRVAALRSFIAGWYLSRTSPRPAYDVLAMPVPSGGCRRRGRIWPMCSSTFRGLTPIICLSCSASSPHAYLSSNA